MVHVNLQPSAVAFKIVPGDVMPFEVRATHVPADLR